MRQEIVGFWDAVALAGPYVNYLHLAPDRSLHQHLITRFLQSARSSWRPTNSVRALKAIALEFRPESDSEFIFLFAHRQILLAFVV